MIPSLSDGTRTYFHLLQTHQKLIRSYCSSKWSITSHLRSSVEHFTQPSIPQTPNYPKDPWGTLEDTCHLQRKRNDWLLNDSRKFYRTWGINNKNKLSHEARKFYSLTWYSLTEAWPYINENPYDDRNTPCSYLWISLETWIRNYFVYQTSADMNWKSKSYRDYIAFFSNMCMYVLLLTYFLVHEHLSNIWI